MEASGDRGGGHCHETVGMVFLGWAPSLAVSYALAFGLSLITGWNGPVIFGATYFGLLTLSLFLTMQVRDHLSLAGPERTWFTRAGGGFRLWTGSL